MMIDAQTYDGQDLLDTVGDDVAAAFASIEGEIQQVAHWMDDAFGGIEADAARFAPTLANVARPIRGTLTLGAALLARMTTVMPKPRLINR
ncbi:MAG: hypothetical protein P1V34_00215 [Alphaproteobacteria bacterium]|nr:hypothetical protein [Alphaproteobacteria bacterium]